MSRGLIALGLTLAVAATAAVGTRPVAPASAAPASAPPAAAGRPATGHAAGLVDDLDCSACHTPAGWGLAATAGVSGFDHARTGFPLRGAHDQRPCGDCHRGQAAPPTTCDGCHRDAHAGRADGACEECHTPTAWSDTAALARHRRTRMPLTGRHAQLDCVACHPRQDARTWTSPPVACFACHADAYRGADTHPDHDGDPADPAQPAFPRDCSRCHRTSAWAPALYDPTILGRSLAGGGAAAAARHDGWFVLSSGPHRDAACASCHVDRRRAARVRCDGCHTDAALRAQHRGQAAVRPAAGCLRCHPRGRAR